MTLHVEIRWSDDGGKNKTPWRIVPLTRRGLGRIRKLGSSEGRIFYLRVSGPYKRNLLAAQGEF